MKPIQIACAVFWVLFTSGCRSGDSMPQEPSRRSVDLDAKAAQRFADLALACVHKEYPNKLSHVLNSDADVAAPHVLTPAFFGCFDWHSAVHGHWLLARLARSFPDAPFAAQAKAALRQSLTEANIAKEVSYLSGEGRLSFERPYGLAWLLQLGVELREWNDPLAHELAAHLKPLEQAAIARLTEYLPKLSHPIRSGEHSQTAFALGLLIDAARQGGDKSFLALLLQRTQELFHADGACPLAYEPSGEDFLSPCLAEADAMRRALPRPLFGRWLKKFLPTIETNGEARWLRPAVVTDRSDPKLVHLDGLNLSRAWMLEGIAAGLSADDPRVRSILAVAALHRQAGLIAVTGEHYEGGHWLGSFAVYLVSHRGLS
jgi:hypothetical protein